MKGCEKLKLKAYEEIPIKTYDEIMQVLIKHRYEYFIYRYDTFCGYKNVVILDDRYNTHFTREEYILACNIVKTYPKETSEYLKALGTYIPTIAQLSK